MIDINLSRKANGVGRHDQIVHFDNKETRYFQGIVYIWENKMVHLVDYLGVEYVINPDKVNYYERFSFDGEGNQYAKKKATKSNHRRRKA